MVKHAHTTLLAEAGIGIYELKKEASHKFGELLRNL
jgi:23S rRNA A2030 N6-methylase RlmJ